MLTENTSQNTANQPMQETGIDHNQPASQRELTYGEKAVGLTFNPGGHMEVNAIKTSCAAAIDILHELRTVATAEGNGEKIAQYTLAIRSIQSGQMWGVKAATWQY